MAYTTHGHHIAGTMTDDIQRPVARCGGPALCRTCSAQAAVATTVADKKVVSYEAPLLNALFNTLKSSGLSDIQCWKVTRKLQKDGFELRKVV